MTREHARALARVRREHTHAAANLAQLEVLAARFAGEVAKRDTDEGRAALAAFDEALVELREKLDRLGRELGTLGEPS